MKEYYRKCVANKRDQLKRALLRPETPQRISDLKSDIRNYLNLLGCDYETQEWMAKVKEYLAYLSTWEVEDLINMIASPSLGPAIIVDEERIKRELGERDRGN